jgi:N-acetylmuramoyl-L-alanine amidase
MNMTRILKRKMVAGLMAVLLLTGLAGGAIAGPLAQYRRRALASTASTAVATALPVAGVTPVTGATATTEATKSAAAPAATTAPNSANPSTRAAEVSRGASRPQTTTSQSQLPPGVTLNDVDLLAHLIFAEAGIEPYSGQVAVGAVVLNRTRSKEFPNTIAGVIYQTGQFEPVGNYYFNSEPSASAKQAALEAVRGTDPSHGALYFFDPSKVTSDFLWGRPMTVTIGGHRFTK